MLTNLFYKASIILITKPDKYHEKENNRSIPLIRINTKVFNKIFAKLNQQYIKRTTHHDQVIFIPGMQGLFNIC